MPSFLREQDNCLDTCLLGRALAGLRVGLVITNPAGRVVWLNRSAQDILGLNGDAFRGETLGRILRDPQLTTFWQDATRTGGTVLGEVSIRWPRQTELKCNTTECLDTNGDLIGRALLFCDVTQEHSVRVELAREVADRLLQLTNGADPTGDPRSGLTPQELHVIRLVGKGLRNQDIADRISISPSTVRTHLKSIYRKLGLASRAQAVRFAVENHLS
jgi:DNA-binding CsgD family transcriptional regulator